MSDIVEELRKWRGEIRAGTGNSDVNVIWIEKQYSIIDQAIAEIERLRVERDHMLALAGKVSIGPAYVDIAKDARHDLPVSERTDG